MSKNGVVVWCSGATDITGSALAEALKASVTKEKPKSVAGLKLIIGWGAKTKKDVSLPAPVNVFNHPNHIRRNRNKLEALKAMVTANVAVPEFIEARGVKTALGNGSIELPLIARTNYHQGGKGAMHCPTSAQVDMALSSETKFGYFQKFVPVQDEFRLHVVDGKVIYAQKKVMRSMAEYHKSYVEKELVRLESLSKKAKEKFDKANTTKMLERQAKNLSIDPLIRSNTRGWKFSHVKKWPPNMEEQAVRACEALGLQFGAVDCCMDVDANPWVIEVNTGPGLQESAFKAWVDALSAMIDKTLNPAKQSKTTASKADSKTVAKAAKKAAAAADGSVKAKLQQTTALMSEMIEKADEDEAKALQSVFGKMFGTD